MRRSSLLLGDLSRNGDAALMHKAEACIALAYLLIERLNIAHNLTLQAGINGYPGAAAPRAPKGAVAGDTSV